MKHIDIVVVSRRQALQFCGLQVAGQGQAVGSAAKIEARDPHGVASRMLYTRPQSQYQQDFCRNAAVSCSRLAWHYKADAGSASVDGDQGLQHLSCLEPGVKAPQHREAAPVLNAEPSRVFVMTPEKLPYGKCFVGPVRVLLKDPFRVGLEEILTTSCMFACRQRSCFLAAICGLPVRHARPQSSYSMPAFRDRHAFLDQLWELLARNLVLSWSLAAQTCECDPRISCRALWLCLVTMRLTPLSCQ